MRWYYYVLTGLYCGLIFLLSSRPDLPDTGALIPMGDKWAHMIAYGGLATIVSVGIRRSNPAVPPAIQWFVPLGFAVFYGLTDEFHQWFVPERSVDPGDVLADGLGAAAAQVFLCGVWWRVPLRHETLA